MAIRITKSSSIENQLKFAKAFVELKKQMAEEKILDRSYGWYVLHIVLNFLGLVVGAFCLYSGLWFLASIIVAFFVVQWGGIMHDGGHLAIAKSKKWNLFCGKLGGGFASLGFSEWYSSHNNHHTHVNEEEEDTDLMIPVLSYTMDRAKTKTGLEKKLLPYQHFLYLFLFSFGSVAIRVKHAKYLFNQKLWLEFLISITSNFFWVVLPVLILGLPGLAFVFFNQFFTGQYMMHIFAPNHKGMPELATGVKLSFLEQQVVTARNLPPHWLIDYVYMGLNYQIEHHLFPHCPRENQPRLAKLVKPFCERMGLEYSVIGPWEVDITLFKELRAVARQF